MNERSSFIGNSKNDTSVVIGHKRNLAPSFILYKDISETNFMHHINQSFTLYASEASVLITMSYIGSFALKKLHLWLCCDFCKCN